MKNCSCIFARQRDGEEAILFEGGHPVPFFWLMLLDADDIAALYEKLKRVPRNGNTEQIDTSIGLDKLKALTRAANRRDYVKQHYTVCLSLYDDWLFFMQISDFADMKIYIDLYETSLNHTSLEHFTDSLQKAVVCFDENKDAWYDITIAGTCGREGRNKNKRCLGDTSHAFQKINRKDRNGNFENVTRLHKKRFASKTKMKRTVLLTILFILALLAAACFYFFAGGIVF